jgi:hypothetical protein
MYFDMDLHSLVSAQDVLLHQFGYSYLNLSFSSLQVLLTIYLIVNPALVYSTIHKIYTVSRYVTTFHSIPITRAVNSPSSGRLSPAPSRLGYLSPPPLQASSPPTSSIPILHLVPAVKSHIRNSPPSFNTLLKGLPAHSTRIRPSLSSRHTG